MTKPSLDDLENIYALQSDPEVMRHTLRGIRNKEQIKKLLDTAIQHYEKHGFGFGAVFEKSSGKFIGRAGLLFLDYDDTQMDVELACLLHKNFWNQGYGTEIFKALIKYGFQNLKIDKLVAITRPKNESSRHVLEKVGMHYMGCSQYHDLDVARYEIIKNIIDYNKIKLIPATLKDYPMIQNMARFYAYDISEYLGHDPGWEMPESGLYECIDFKKYWETKEAFPFLIRYDNELAGFAIVDKKGSSPDIDFNMAQFFILRKFKHKGMGRYVAGQLFDKFPGTWEAMVLPGNEGSYRATRATIRNYTKGEFTEYTCNVAHFNNRQYNIFRFRSG